MEKQFKAIVMHGFSDEEAFSIMKSIKALDFGASSTAFATTTATSLEWKVEYLLEHLKEEHEHMRALKGKADQAN